ncbi:hypothetical protein EOI86_22895 [Hwanghaeella grinnelliae]|uniref:Uncharacterized protein n=1 Tax=Hwanghaeella grinnelliae TaxID=2500179 RepID=A0A437QHP5_9PROT|nr:hypothetical protein [Hwanghaeella grinnelliae]RVU33976.1 hypothetical protein EOI86_22895 [Hwanghaeella grinnelliae]
MGYLSRFLGKKNLKNIANLLDSKEQSEGFALSRFQALNSSGLDLKGQVSSAYAMSGIGLGAGVAADLGSVIAPLLHLKPGVKIKGEATANALVVIARTPCKAWKTLIEELPQPDPARIDVIPSIPPTDWHSTRPLQLGFLRGTRGMLNAKLTAQAWAGIAQPADTDETGLSIGLSGEVGGQAEHITVYDANPKYFGLNPKGKDIADAVDELMSVNIKRKAAAWILINGNGIKEARELGFPIPFLETFFKQLPANTETIAKNFDEATIPDLASQSIVKNTNTLVYALAERAHSLNNMLGKGVPDTARLVQMLQDSIKDINARIESLKGDFFKDEEERLRVEIWLENRDDIANLEQRIREAETLIRQLEERKLNKKTGGLDWSQGSLKTGGPAMYLSLIATTKQFDLNAGAKAIFNGSSFIEREKPLFRASAKAQRGLSQKKIAFSYQTHARGVSRALQDLITTQNTNVTYSIWTARATAVLQGANIRSRKKEKTRDAWTTMSYRSVLVNWFDTIQQAPSGKPGKAGTAQSLPNGSGVSFGMSVTDTKLAEYIRACKPPPGQKTPPANIPEDLVPMEAAMTRQLRVTKAELRRFMRHQPSGMDNALREHDTFLVESAFAFTQPQSLTIKKFQAVGLRDLAPVTTLEKVKDAETQTRPPELKLQSIRLRYRIRDDKERHRHPFSFGIAPEFFGGAETADLPGTTGAEGDDKDAPPKPDPDVDQPKTEEKSKWLKLLIKYGKKLTGSSFTTASDEICMAELPMNFIAEADWVTRVGCEGIVDVTIVYFPSPYHTLKPKDAEAAEASQHQFLGELRVPGVTLFSQ